MSDIANEICRLAAEMADRIEAEPHDHFDFEMKATFFEWDNQIIEPRTLTFSAKWVSGEWKFTKREQYDTWEPVIWKSTR